MLGRVFYNLERKEKGKWIDFLGSYDKADTEAWMNECKADEPGEYRIREVKEEFGWLLTDLCAVRMSELPQDKEVIILSPETFLEYISRLGSFKAEVLSIGENGELGDKDSAYILTLEEDPMEDGKERKWDFQNLCATEEDADKLIARLK